MTLAVCGLLALSLLALTVAGSSGSDGDAELPTLDSVDLDIKTVDLMDLPVENSDHSCSQDVDGARKSA